MIGKRWRGSILLLGLLWPSTGGAQAPCREVLREAESRFEDGQIYEAFNVEAACLAGRASLDEQIRALALVAKAWAELDEVEKTAETVDALMRLDPEFRPGRLDPRIFRELVEAARASRVTTRVGTVSKTDEPLREAPATVVVVTAAEIERRGYLDLEQVLHDLPGFDISRGNGDVYSNIYQRGYRSDRSDRMLFLVDGVEQNDLHSNTAHLSRQYPLSNIEQIEVVYGPASTIYGPNAFTGVVSVTTKAPDALVAEGERFGVHAQLGGGSFNSRFVDATLAGRRPDGRLSWSVTGRFFQSDERDLSSFADWDYAASLEDVDYFGVLRIEDRLAAALAGAGIEAACAGLCAVRATADGTPVIDLTPEGEALARSFDQQLLASLAGQGLLTFDDETDDWAVDARVRAGDFTFGVQTWQRDEGTTPWYTDTLRTGTDNRSTPTSTAIYARYRQPLGRSLELGFFSRFKRHETDAATTSRLGTYAGGEFSLIDLFLETPAAFQQVRFDQKSTQIRNEISLLYQPSSRFNLVAGVELRNSTIQIELQSAELDRSAFSFIPFATQRTDSKVDQTDLGLFAQASYRLRDDLKIVAGGRLDINSVGGEAATLVFDDPNPAAREPRSTRDLPLRDSGSVFNPRLAIVHTRGDFVLKAIYAEAFKDPSNFQRFSRDPGVREFVNPALEPETVRNLELHANWHPHEALSIDLVTYQADYSNSVALRQVINPDVLAGNLLAAPLFSGSFTNIGRLEIRGLQAAATWRRGELDLWGNYTFTDPKNVDPTNPFGEPLPGIDELRIGDIAGHRVNLGANLPMPARWNLDLRANWVGERRSGFATTVPSNPFDEVDAYLTVHSALSYRGLLPGATWQLVVNNLFDADFEHPGVQQAGEGFAALLPQPGRTVFLRLAFKR